jgi:hypothetical protein
MKDRAARPKSKPRGRSVTTLALCAVSTEGMLSKYVTSTTGRYDAKAVKRVTLYIVAARSVVRTWMVGSVTISRLETTPDVDELDTECAGDSGRKRRNGM